MSALRFGTFLGLLLNRSFSSGGARETGGLLRRSREERKDGGENGFCEGEGSHRGDVHRCQSFSIAIALQFCIRNGLLSKDAESCALPFAVPVRILGVKLWKTGASKVRWVGK